ncbi:MAG: glutamate racemase [Candidatus Muproteobacteria bacterium RBG_16_60_9]|uniref:Glutamate racemase n=1 Tax=Candidatus Muproteobacteria bacterium RBG_16_60_9 TaxID=1817755 RepID=A0A1F6UVA0_9PROT|nr:MAG: glutamate racemase [Candidatus Muproteobacteria bacterium RBG_16_60_9]
MNPQPIGVFDSGVGGLSVLREIRALLPHEDVLYVADSAHVPYGDKPPAFVRARSMALSQFLLDQGAKAIVIACNTATAIAIADLRAHFAVPIVGMEPAVKPASAHSRTRCIGVLATSGTLASDKFASLLARFGRDVEVHVQPCSGLVEQVERGALNSDATRALVEKYVTPLARRGVDTIVLGCTHYPFLRPVIAEFAGANVSIIDPNPAVARELRRQLERSHLRAPADHPGAEKFWTSAEPSSVQNVMIQLWGDPVAIMRLPTLTPDNRLNDAKLE